MVEKKNVPIIFIHRGLSEYLKKTVACAKEHNNRVIVLGDDNNKEEQAGEWYAISDYKSIPFEEFKRAYIHCSTNEKWFELVCFERYFVLLEFMRKKELEECFMMDSDVLLFGNASTLVDDNFDMGGGDDSIMANPCLLWWTISALEDFVLFCLEQYINKKKWIALYGIYNGIREGKRQSFKGGISDMLLLKLWMESTTYKCKNFFLNEADYIIDGNINAKCGNIINANCVETYRTNYKLKKGLKVKKYIFIDRIPFIIDCNNKRHRVLAVHCQGDAKMFIDLLYSRRFGILVYRFWIDGIMKKIKLTK